MRGIDSIRTLLFLAGIFQPHPDGVTRLIVLVDDNSYQTDGTFVEPMQSWSLPCVIDILRWHDDGRIFFEAEEPIRHKRRWHSYSTQLTINEALSWTTRCCQRKDDRTWSRYVLQRSILNKDVYVPTWYGESTSKVRLATRTLNAVLLMSFSRHCALTITTLH